MSILTPDTKAHWSPDVVAFAVQHNVDGYLDPLLETLRKQFPTTLATEVLLEEDPEIRDDRHIVFDVLVPGADVPDYVEAKRRWHRELFRICPAPLVSVFRLGLRLTD